MTPITQLKIDFVSDISCPWCAIGLAALEQALARAQDAVQAELHIQPFELNPQMAPGGEDLVAHLSAKYGSSPAQIAQIHETIRQRGAEVGFVFGPGRSRLYNTFDAHRLIYWAGLHTPAQQYALKKALQVAYFTDGHSPEDPAALCQAAAQVGLDAQAAARVLASDDYADEVRDQERLYQQAGIRSVPAVIINDRHLISGGQPVEVFEQALRQIAAGA